MEIKDKVVLVTGASSGIGLAAARLLAESGARLALNARSRDKLEQVSRELPGSAAFPADMSDELAVRRMVADVRAAFGRIDVLVNNAGRGTNQSVESLDVAAYRRLIDLNVIGPLVAMQAVIPLMRQQGAGSIVAISSGTALMYAPGLAGYSATKRALNGLSLTARNELAPDGIVVSVVYPYVTKSDFYRNLVAKGERGDTAEEYAAGRAPADTSEYVAGLIAEAIRTGAAEIFAHEWMKGSMR
ncbi:MAG TPA: SDR family oxidoreductase [Spirochaetia bacterium]|nr:SDR family oxidoreductase [Spirochaetia bacterium]